MGDRLTLTPDHVKFPLVYNERGTFRAEHLHLDGRSFSRLWSLSAATPGQQADSGQSHLGWQLALLRLLKCDSIKCHFGVGSEPLWAWVWTVLNG